MADGDEPKAGEDSPLGGGVSQERTAPRGEEQPLTGVGITILLKPGSVDLAGFQLHGNPSTPQFVALAGWLDAWAKMRQQAELQAILQQMNQRAPLLVPNGHAKMPPPPKPRVMW